MIFELASLAQRMKQKLKMERVIITLVVVWKLQIQQSESMKHESLELNYITFL